MEFREFPKIARLSREVIVTEKIDGTNASVYVVDMTKTPDEREDYPRNVQPIIALGGDVWLFAASRTRWIPPQEDNHGWTKFVAQNANELALLGPGFHYGEWWGSGIQRGYGLPKGEKRFSLFNVARWADESVRPPCCSVVPILARVPDFGLFDVWAIMGALKDGGSVAAPGFMKPEGIVIFHAQGNVGFKKTFEKDDAGKNHGA